MTVVIIAFLLVLANIGLARSSRQQIERITPVGTVRVQEFPYSVVLAQHPYYRDWLMEQQFGLSMKGEIDAAGFVCEQTPWCDQTFGQSNWVFRHGRFCFKNESDSVMFLLRWS